MNEKFVSELVELGNIDLVMRRLQQRRDEILDAIAAGKTKPTPGLMVELADLNIACGDVEVQHGS